MTIELRKFFKNGNNNNDELKFGYRTACCARLCGAIPFFIFFYFYFLKKAWFCRQARASQPLFPRALTGSWAPHHPRPPTPFTPPIFKISSYLHLLIYFPFHRMCWLSAPLIFRRSAFFFHLCHVFSAILLSIFAARRGRGEGGWMGEEVWKGGELRVRVRRG